MKIFKHAWVLGVIALLAFQLGGATAAQAQPGGRVSFQTFYDELEPYGRWINDPEYGYVWSPDVDQGFQPYASRGHWVMTEYGNTWVSDYDWGWAPFHYGRWAYDDYYGWLWVPGNEWGPAWVDWRRSDGYYGWAPMGPRITYVMPASRWCFVPVMYISSPRIYHYYVPQTRVVNIYHNTTIINNYYERDHRKYVYGPRTQDIERATNRKVNVYRVDNDSRPGRNQIADNTVRIYRPEVSNRRSEAPARVEARDNQSQVRTSRESNAAATTTRTERSTAGSRAATEAPATRRRVSTTERSEQRTSEASGPERTEPRAGTVREQRSSRGQTAPDNTQAPVRTERSQPATRTREQAAPSPRQRSSNLTPAPEAERRTEYAPRRTEASSQATYAPPRAQSAPQPQPIQERSRATSAPQSSQPVQGAAQERPAGGRERTSSRRN
ncbi:hypothetical protein GU926_18285 [Nibribacter ruber]|uniref:BcpO-related WXXGXW repeat protein n=1 Tax=Nibribacter ruber TaxID=2698458 RepID=A0A6P1P4J0_9BACT|nr:DUF6600 domain-containing protein [Nibribacter ruber]QHL89275.1 hypothetical protein GU926_18285 [Nibribacter ruber]